MADNLNLYQQKAQLRREEEALIRKINALNEDDSRTQEEVNRLARERIELGQKLKNVNLEIQKNQRSAYAEAQDDLKSMSTMYDKLKKADLERIDLMMKAGDISDAAVTRGNSLAEINRKIAELTSDQTIQREILQDQFDSEIAKFAKQKNISKEIVDNLKEQNQLANDYASMTEGQKEQLEAQLEAYNAIKKTLGGILDTASILTSGPAGFFGTVLIGAGMFADKLGEVRSQLGGISEFGTTAISFFDDNAVENAKELANQFGGINNVSTELQASTSLISANMGISGTEAASLAGSFARLNDGSAETALNLTKSTQEFAKQNGLIPSDLLADLAGSAEEFALFGKEGGKNLIQAGAAAKKMGVSLKTMTGIADNLLDFENSITKELELGAMLGKNINLDRARALAYQGDITGATKETLNALGGVEAFNKMDYFQKKATADLLGTSVDELQKMVTQQENANTLGGQLNEKFSMAGEFIDAGLNKYLGTSLKSLGGMVMAGAQLGGSFAQMGMDVKGMASKIPLVGRLFGGGKPAAAGASLAQQAPAGGADKAAGGMDKLSKINGNGLIKAAGAILIASAALWVMGKALQQFKEVGWEELGKAGAALVGLGVVMAGFGMLSGIIYAGSLALLAASTAFMVFGAAVGVVGIGMKLFAEGLSAISTVLPNVVDSLSLLSQINFLPILGLAASLGVLAMALTAVAASGLLALPILAGLGLISGGGLFGGEEGGQSEDARMDTLIEEIKGLRSDLNSGKIAVYMDGGKVTSKISKVIDKIGGNSYGAA